MAPRRRPGAHRRSARLFAHDRALGTPRVAGVDEAGRGCLAGPLVVAAVCLDLGALSPSGRRALGDLDDSKRLAPDVRERVAAAVMRHAEQVVVLLASPRTIDRDGLHRTNLRLMREALARLAPCPGVCLVDGFRLGPTAVDHRAVVGGDGRSASIAADANRIVPQIEKNAAKSGESMFWRNLAFAAACRAMQHPAAAARRATTVVDMGML